jgi:ribonuclease HI
MYAILRALTYLNDQPKVILQAVILTDSKSSLQSINNRKGQRGEMIIDILWLCQQLKEKGTSLTLCWIPSHTGIRGNDLADRAASFTALQNNHQINDIGLAPGEAKAMIWSQISKRWKQNKELLINYTD